MIKNAILYSYAGGTALTSALIDQAMTPEMLFEPIGATQSETMGWAPPRGNAFDELVACVDGQYLMKLMIETKQVPASAIQAAVEEKVTLIERLTGRKPGRQECRELKEDARIALLPMAFAKRSAVLVWIDPAAQMIVFDAATNSRSDQAATALVRLVDGLHLSLIQTTTSAGSAMAMWLYDPETLPPEFSIGRACELQACDESSARVRYTKHSLDTDEVRHHIKAGKMPNTLALHWKDRVSLTLDKNMCLRGIEFEDVVFESSGGENKADAFDADAAIMTGELRGLIPDLIGALGGALVQAAIADSATQEGQTSGELDPLYGEALALVRANNKASISLVQRHLKIGYNRAARLLEQMEVSGAVSPMRSNGQREVIQ